MCSQKTVILQNASSVLSFTLAVTCRLCLDPVKCLLRWYSLEVNKSTTQLYCRFVGGASQLMCSAIRDRSTCKSVLASLFSLLIVPYNSVYYNYIIIMQQLVGSGVKVKREFASAKKCTVAPVSTQV